MPKSSYEQAYDGVPYTVKTNEPTYDACCDCGLIHETNYKIIDKDTIEITVKRDNRRTAQYRRHPFANFLDPKRWKKFGWRMTKTKK